MISTLSSEFLAAVILLLPFSYLITRSYRVYALNQNILDIPNHRSSHEVPTPRGGGVSIIISYTLITLGLGYIDALSSNHITALLVASLPIAAIGLLDDHKPVPSSIRFSIHFASAATALSIFTAPPTLAIGDTSIAIDGLWIIPAAICLTWLTNLYNFMDGIDGIAGTEAICVLSGALVISVLLSNNFLPALFITPILGFLILNWAPARIFMGDAGSGFIGAFLGMLAITLAALESINLWAWMILLGTFIVDSSWTLTVRFLDGQQWHKPHRSHGYQILSRKLGSHPKVNSANAAITMLWLTPLAYATQCRPQLGIIITAIAYAPLVLIVYKLKAGMQQ